MRLAGNECRIGPVSYRDRSAQSTLRLTFTGMILADSYNMESCSGPSSIPALNLPAIVKVRPGVGRRECQSVRSIL